MGALFSTVRLGSRKFLDHALFWSLSLWFQRRLITEQFAERVMGLTLFLKQFSHGFNHFQQTLRPFSQLCLHRVQLLLLDLLSG